MPEILDVLDLEFDDPELEPFVVPIDARLSFRMRSAEFLSTFDRLAALAPQKEQVPGTSFIRLSIEDDVLHMVGTDGSQSLSIAVDQVSILREGKALFPAHKVRQIASLLPDEFVTITVLSESATITSGRAVWHVTVPVTDYAHVIPDVSELEFVEVDRRGLVKALTAASKFVPSLGGRRSLEQVKVAGGYAVASDGYRLIRHVIADFPPSLAFEVPKESLSNLLRLLTTGKQPKVSISAGKSLVVVRNEADTLIVRQIDLEFPNVEPLLLAPALQNDRAFTINVGELLDLIKRVRVSADPEYSTVVLSFRKVKNEWELQLSAQDRSGNSASDSMFAMWEEGEPSSLALSHRFLADLLDAYPGNLATFRVGESSKTRAAPLYVKDEETGFAAVIQQSLKR